MNTPTRTRIITAAALTLTAAGLLFAGPLTPPAGPVTSTYKTLTEVEPRIAINLTNTPGDADSLFKITQRGSYYLTGNITGVVGRRGIEIAASGVTLDLMGFDLLGVVGSLDGVSPVVGSLTNITIRNGSIRGWGGDGVDLGTVLTNNSAVTDVRASGNTGIGIRVGSNSTITGCSAYNNTANGISTGFGCTITGCSASFNNGNGIWALEGCTITGCTADQNTGNGISVGSGSTVAACTARSNSGDGISTGDGSTVTGCTARANSGNGIAAGLGSTVAGCTARLNTGDGIQVSSDCRVTDNTCDANGNGGDGAGIHATGSDNRIEGNHCTDNDRGIDVDFAGNIIIKNTCSGNTFNWSIAIGNSFGPIVAAGTNAAVVNTNGAVAGNLGSTDPNANFSF